MHFLLWLMLVGFALAGVMLIYLGLRGLFTMASRRGLLIRSVGTIKAIEKKHVPLVSRSTRTRYSFLPIVTYGKETGEPAEFRSEVGDFGYETKYRIGQTVDVLYDPNDILPPMIDVWFARWGVHLIIIFCGILFLGGAALVYWVLGQRV